VSGQITLGIVTKPANVYKYVRLSLSLHRASWYTSLCSPTDALIYYS